MEMERSLSAGCSFFCASNCLFYSLISALAEVSPVADRKIARFADSLDIGVRERNEDSSLSYWIRWRRLKKNKFEEGRANKKFSFGCVY